MKNYTEYANKIEWIEKTLAGMLWLKLSYVKSESESMNKYVNYISNKFFPNKKEITQYDIEERLVVIQSAIKWYKNLKRTIQNDQELTPNLKKFIIKRLQENLNRAKIAKRSVFFEAEKFGYDILFEESTFEIKKNNDKINKIWFWEEFNKKKKKYLKDIDILQTKIYGPRITDVKEEKDLIISICNEKYIKNSGNLSLEEKIFFENFLWKFTDNIEPKDIKIAKKLPSRWNLSMDDIMSWTEHIKNIFYPNIKREQKKEKGKKWYSVPFETKIREYPDQESDDFNKILTTIWHEDAGHMVRGDNQEKNWLIIAWAWYENIEEWITKLNEWLLKYSLDEYPLIPNDTFMAVFIWENYNFEDTYKLIKIIKKLGINWQIDIEKEKTISKAALNLAERVKWYYPRDGKWSNRKDVIYFRWEKKIIEYLKSLPDNEARAEWYRKAMSAKVSFEDIFTIDELLEEIGPSTENTSKNKLVDKIFNVKLEKWVWAFSKVQGEDGKRNIDKNLLNGDFRFNGMEEYSMREKKAIIELFNIVKYKKYKSKNISEDDYKKINKDWKI